jgi:hypothetical protein
MNDRFYEKKPDYTRGQLHYFTLFVYQDANNEQENITT